MILSRIRSFPTVADWTRRACDWACLRIVGPLRERPNLAQSQHGDRKWFASISCDMGDAPDKTDAGFAIGVDAVNSFAVTSDGEHIANQKRGKSACESPARQS